MTFLLDKEFSSTFKISSLIIFNWSAVPSPMKFVIPVKSAPSTLTTTPPLAPPDRSKVSSDENVTGLIGKTNDEIEVDVRTRASLPLPPLKVPPLVMSEAEDIIASKLQKAI